MALPCLPSPLKALTVGRRKGSLYCAVNRAEDAVLPKNAKRLFTLIAKAADGAGLELGQSRVRAAAHESGHALAAWSSIHVVRVTGARLQGPGNGMVRFDMVDAKSRGGAAWDRVMIGLAGLAGEILTFGSVRSADAEYDLTAARDDAARIVAGGWQRPWSPTDGRGLDIGAMFAEPPTPAVRETLGECYRRARVVILHRPDLFGMLQRELLRHGEIDADGIVKLLGDRPWARLR